MSFNRNEQLAICAKLIGFLRGDASDKQWGRLNNKENGARDGSSELKFILSKIISWSSESVDFTRTVDFVTRETYYILKREERCDGTIPLGVLTSLRGFSHEHMIPCEALFQIITMPWPGMATLFLTSILDAFSYRALVEGKTRNKQESNDEDSATEIADQTGKQTKNKNTAEILKLGPWNTKLPAAVCVEGCESPILLENICCKHFPFLRYDAARLLCELIPVNVRAEQRLDSYLRFRNGNKELAKLGNTIRLGVDGCCLPRKCEFFSNDMAWRKVVLAKISGKSADHISAKP